MKSSNYSVFFKKNPAEIDPILRVKLQAQLKQMQAIKADYDNGLISLAEYNTKTNIVLDAAKQLAVLAGNPVENGKDQSDLDVTKEIPKPQME
jgi:hypothetical protein